MGNNDRIELEEGREFVRRTIVGGRPRAKKAKKVPVPIGVEKVLCRAAGDPKFRAALFDNRERAIQDAGYTLRESERTILMSVPDAAMVRMIGNIDIPKHAKRRFMRAVTAVTFAAAAAAGAAACDDDAVVETDAVESDTVESDTVDTDTVESDSIDPWDVSFAVDSGEPLDIEEDTQVPIDMVFAGVMPEDTTDPGDVPDADLIPDTVDPGDVSAGVDTGSPPDAEDTVDVEPELPWAGVMPPDLYSDTEDAE